MSLPYSRRAFLQPCLCRQSPPAGRCHPRQPPVAVREGSGSGRCRRLEPVPCHDHALGLRTTRRCLGLELRLVPLLLLPLDGGHRHCGRRCLLPDGRCLLLWRWEGLRALHRWTRSSPSILRRGRRCSRPIPAVGGPSTRRCCGSWWNAATGAPPRRCPARR